MDAARDMIITKKIMTKEASAKEGNDELWYKNVFQKCIFVVPFSRLWDSLAVSQNFHDVSLTLLAISEAVSVFFFQALTIKNMLLKTC